MKKIILFFAIIIFTNQMLFGQQDISLKNIVPPSPEASAFAKYGTYPIGTYTGRPDINIPIYEIKVGGLSVPISLSYDATGIRVNDMASWVGMNWSLNAGGMISQMVVGEPDINSSTGWDAVPPRAADIVNNTTYFNYLQALVDGDQIAPANPDGDPDRFFYSFNGRNGSFVLDRSRNIMQIPKTSLKISITGSLSSSNPSFKIIDENGVTFIFSILEKTETYNYNAEGSSPYVSSSGSIYKNQTTAYYLSEIISQEGQHIYFSYENETTATRDDMFSETFGPKYNHGNQSPTQNYHGYRWKGVQRVISIPRLKTITFATGKVEFSRFAGRQDDAGGSSRLDEITIYQKSNSSYIKLKSFKFNQGYYYSSADYGQYSGIGNQIVDRYRLRLDSIGLKDALGSTVASYKFVYNSTQLPPKTSCSQDWWGYYNGTSNMTLVPTTSVPDGSGGTLTIGGADRSSDETYMKAGILQKIIYPTGGYTIFETEAHKLFEQFSNIQDGLQAYALGQSVNNVAVQTFTIPTNLVPGSGHLNITICPYDLNAVHPFVKIKNMSSGVEQTFTSSDNTQWYSADVNYNFVTGIAYQITASCYVNQSNAMASINALYTKAVSDPHTTPVGGLRIKSIKNYNIDNSLATEENYAYGPNENGGGVFVGIQGNANSYGRGQQVSVSQGSYCWVFDGGVYNIFTGGPLFDQALVQGSPVVYTDVAKYIGNSTGNTGKTIYHYGTSAQQIIETRPLPSGQSLANNQGIIIINNTWKKGKLLSQQDYKRNNDGSYSLAREIENGYNVVYTDTTYGLIAQTKFDRIFFIDGCKSRNFSDYAYADYPVYSGYVQLSQTTKKEYSNGTNMLQTIINHIYDNTYNDIEVKTSTLSSKGETLETEKKYPFNKAQLITPITPAESTVLDDMVTKNIIAPVEEIRRDNNVQLTLKKTSYEYVNGSIIAPVNIKFQVRSNPIETRVLFNKYDNYGNLLEQQKPDDIKEVYVWGYNSEYPVAKVIGITYNDVIGVLNESILNNPPGDATLRNELNKIRTNFPSAQVTTYTYNPLVGMTSATDVNGKTSYYIYDTFGRLVLIKDKDGNIVKKFCYNYLGHPGTCAIFGNTPQSLIFTKECTAGYTGTPVTYTVPANTYYASTQPDADAIALNDVNTNGQAYANATGTCTYNPMINIQGSNSKSSTYQVRFTNNASNNWYTFILNANSGLSNIGQVPPGTYTVLFYPMGSTVSATFNINGYTYYGTGATFYNISITSASTARMY